MISSFSYLSAFFCYCKSLFEVKLTVWMLGKDWCSFWFNKNFQSNSLRFLIGRMNEYVRARCIFRASMMWTLVPRWCNGNVNITDWMYGLFGVPSSIPLNLKTVQMLFNVVWCFLLTVWTTVMRLCAELIPRHTKSQTHLKLREVSSRRSYPHEGF